ncbi:MAG TPA: hypothetical protein VLK33_00765, partial [Terriglobales bacterium]|nr:hypothetical protein [Terriglobales bacterium]
MNLRLAAALSISALMSALNLVGQSKPDSSPTVIHVHSAPADQIKTFDPDIALGTSIDILPQGIVDKVYTPNILKESLSAGWGPITYRQNTELQGTAWHWNPNGTWSDPEHQSGYFVASSEPKDFIRHSYGYALPHRGNTAGDGRSRSKYSRITDGDPKTYWKSDPYLTSKFTGESDAEHPQWAVI